MKWYQGRPQLKLTGYGCAADEIVAVFQSCMVDVAYVAEVTPEAVFIVADDPAWPKDQRDYDGLCAIIRETLGIEGIELTFVPAPTGAARAEPHERRTP